MNPWMGILASITFILLVIGISEIASKKQLLNNEDSRKFIHITVSNWWILAMVFFDSPYTAMIVPLLFVVVNYISYKKQVFSAMERDGGFEDLGTVYYAVSLVVLSIWTFAINQPWIGAVGILTMGYGDGYAAVIGAKFGKTKLPGIPKKSFEGSSAMFGFSLIIPLILLMIFTELSLPVILSISLMSALLATILEALTPLGFDNLSVPISVSLFMYLVITWGPF